VAGGHPGTPHGSRDRPTTSKVRMRPSAGCAEQLHVHPTHPRRARSFTIICSSSDDTMPKNAFTKSLVVRLFKAGGRTGESPFRHYAFAWQQSCTGFPPKWSSEKTAKPRSTGTQAALMVLRSQMVICQPRHRPRRSGKCKRRNCVHQEREVVRRIRHIGRIRAPSKVVAGSDFCAGACREAGRRPPMQAAFLRPPPLRACPGGAGGLPSCNCRGPRIPRWGYGYRRRQELDRSCGFIRSGNAVEHLFLPVEPPGIGRNRTLGMLQAGEAVGGGQLLLIHRKGVEHILDLPRLQADRGRNQPRSVSSTVSIRPNR